MPDPIDAELVRRPEVLLGRMLRTYAHGGFSLSDESPKFLHRAAVLAVDSEGGMLSGPSVGSGEVLGVGVDGRERGYARIVGPANPPGSVKAIVIDAARDSFYDEESARVLWPFFPTDQFSLPISPGEHVYAVFEDPSLSHGLWLCRVSGQDSPNVMPGSDFYASRDDGGRRLQSLFDPATAPPPARRSGDDVTTRVRPAKRRLAGLF